MDDNVVLFDGKPKGEDPPAAEHACPVKAIGHNDGMYYYVTPSGALRQLSAAHHTHNNLFSLFEDRAEWLAEKHPKKSRGDNREGWDHTAVGEFLMVEAAKVGLVDLEKSLRGFGVWRCKDNTLVIHTGDRLQVNDEWQRAGQKIDDKIFIALPPIDRPAASEATTPEMDRLFRFIQDSWSWSNFAGDPRLLYGWIGCGILTGALDWRPHIWATADRGSGKSKLDKLLQSVLGSGSDKVSDPTGAAVRGILGVSARGILADEVEPGDNRRAESMIELARMASTDGQGDVVRGTSDGRTQRFPIRACFLFSSILVPNFRPQDFGRITIIEMRPLKDKSPEEIRDFEAVFAELCQMGGRVRRRVINAWSRFTDNLQTYSSVMARDGHGRRAADQIATLLAMSDAMMKDKAVTEEEAAQILGLISVKDLTGGDEIGDDVECIQHLMTSPIMVRFNEGNQKFPIGELVAECPDKSTNWRQRELRRIGLGVSFEEGIGYLVVANTHQEISRLFKGTRWASGGHSRVLKRLPYAQRDANKVVSFSGTKSRATWLLLDDLPIFRKSADEIEGGEGDGSVPDL